MLITKVEKMELSIKKNNWRFYGPITHNNLVLPKSCKIVQNEKHENLKIELRQKINFNCVISASAQSKRENPHLENQHRKK